MEQPIQQSSGAEAVKPAQPVDAATKTSEQQPLPPLSTKDFRIYNSMAEHMNYFVRPPQMVVPRTTSHSNTSLT